MNLDILVNERLLKVKLIERNNNLVKIQVNDKIYDIDIVKACENNYSVLYQGKSHVIDLATTENPKNYSASTYTNNYKVQIIDAQAKLRLQNKSTTTEIETKTILSPMAGSVVKILVNVGDEVKKGQTLIVVEAMKMQSEFKASLDAIVKKISVKEGATISGGQILIELK